MRSLVVSNSLGRVSSWRKLRTHVSPRLDGPPKFHAIVSTPRIIRAFAPGGIGNIGPGIDILGCAVTGAGDAVRAERSPVRGVRIAETGHPDLSSDPTRHAAGIAALEVLDRANASDGVTLFVEKGLPLAGGQGGSAASAVAGAVATNALIGSPLDRSDVLAAALVAEEQLAGRHIDNLAPALFGGIVLIRSIAPLEFTSLPIPDGLYITLVHPSMRLRTAESRAVLPPTIDRGTALAQAGAVAAMVAAFCTGDLTLLRGAIDDRIAEPARGPLLPGFVEAKVAAIEAGAFGCSISGGGPSAFALSDDPDRARTIGEAMVAAYAAAGLTATARVATVDRVGAQVSVIE
jgi:homoserine kinase